MIGCRPLESNTEISEKCVHGVGERLLGVGMQNYFGVGMAGVSALLFSLDFATNQLFCLF